MASVTSRSLSPHSPYDFDFDSNHDSEESWQFLPDLSSAAGSAPASSVFLSSPSSGSLNEYGIIRHHHQHSTSTSSNAAPAAGLAHSPGYISAVSPLQLNMNQQAAHATFSTPSYSVSDPSESTGPVATSVASEAAFSAASLPEPFLPADANLLLSDGAFTGLDTFIGNFPSDVLGTAADSPQEPTDFSALQSSIQLDAPWDPAALGVDHLADGMVMRERPDASQRVHMKQASVTSSPSSFAQPSATAPVPPRVGVDEAGLSSSVTSTASAAPKARVKRGRIEKKKQQQAADSSSKFVIVTPTSISAHAGRPNPFECFEAAVRPTQRGRKGPLANDTKESALQVRRLGACFCCHARKVKCDKERPCKNCKKLAVQVPQIVCWQFPDFLAILFPDFVRSHFRKEEMTKFLGENIKAFEVEGDQMPCHVSLFSGQRFSATLTILAKFFTPNGTNVLRHWHKNVHGDRVTLDCQKSTPIGLEIENNGQREELKKKVRAYIQSIIGEPAFADQLTDSFVGTKVPERVLRIVHNYANRSQSPMVKKALSIYAMHYVMTRHLCMTRQTIINLQHTGLVPQNEPWVTPRVLNRQIKLIVDELLQKEMTDLFDSFSKSLKPKSRREWAPCLASFLVLCLFMESVETGADTFVIAENEVSLRKRQLPPYKREFAIKVCQEVENMPFKQFAFQFHQIYQTHSKDASAKSFNPLIDDSLLEQGELDGPARDMVMALRIMLEGASWQELDFLSMDPILGTNSHEEHPFPREVAMDYTGRLVSKFLLSFTDEKYIFGSAL